MLVLPNGRPVRLCSCKSRTSSSRTARFKKAFQSPTIAKGGVTLTKRLSRPDKWPVHCSKASPQRRPQVPPAQDSTPHKCAAASRWGSSMTNEANRPCQSNPAIFRESRSAVCNAGAPPDRPPQAHFDCGNGNQMNMIGHHQAIAPNRRSLFTAPIGHQFQIGRVVAIVEKRLLSAVPSLGDVMGQTSNDQPCQSHHARNLSNPSHLVNISIVSPEFPSCSSASSSRKGTAAAAVIAGDALTGIRSRPPACKTALGKTAGASAPAAAGGARSARAHTRLSR